MSLNRRPITQSRPPSPRGGPPAWLVFLLGVALVFGVYYLVQGVQDFVASGGLGVVEATNRAATETATVTVRQPTPPRIAGGDAMAQSEPSSNDLLGQGDVSPVPTFTPVPDCMTFVVSVDRASVRALPSTDAPRIDIFDLGREVCVLGRAPDAAEWYLLDLDPNTRRVNEAYMFQDVIEALNPTPTPTMTFTPAPTVTPMPTATPTITPTPRPTNTADPNITPSPTPTPTPTPTLPLQSASIGVSV